MKLSKVTIGFLFVIGFLSTKCTAQESAINIMIYDTNDLKFLNDVEDRLKSVVKNNNNDVTLYDVYPNDLTELWCIPLTKYEVADKSLPRNCMMTNTFLLSIHWNNNLDTGRIMGFSRMYYQEFFINRAGQSYDQGTFFSPLYTVPLNQYSAFLNEKEMLKLYTIIRGAFMLHLGFWESDYLNYVRGFAVPLRYPVESSVVNDTISQRDIKLSRGDSILPQFSMTFWAYLVKRGIRDGEFTVWSKSIGGKELIKTEAEEIFSHGDTLSNQDNKKVVINEDSFVNSLSVSEDWKIEKPSKESLRGNSLSAMVITRKIVAIGLNTTFNEPTYGFEVHNGTGWIMYNEIEKSQELNSGKLSLWKEVINSELYKKLNVQYPQVH